MKTSHNLIKENQVLENYEKLEGISSTNTEIKNPIINDFFSKFLFIHSLNSKIVNKCIKEKNEKAKEVKQKK